MTRNRMFQKYRLLVIACSFICTLNSFKFPFHINSSKKVSKNALNALSDDKERPSPLIAIDRIDQEIKETFPLLSYSSLVDRDVPDYEKLSPDDPLFLDMSWPVERNAESSAFARHIQWKRRLSNSERTYVYLIPFFFFISIFIICCIHKNLSY